MKRSAVWFAGFIILIGLTLPAAQAQSVTHVFNGAAVHDGAAAARLAGEAHLGSDARAADHFHSPEANNHLTITHPSTSEFNGFDGHGTTVSHDAPKAEPKPEPRVTASTAKVHPSSNEFKGFEGHGGTVSREAGGAKTFDQARSEAFGKAGMTDGNVKFTKVDPKTGTVVEFKGSNGAKVAYDGPHETPGPGHDSAHVGWQTGGKRGVGGRERGNISYAGPQHPSRSDIKGEGNIDPH